MKYKQLIRNGQTHEYKETFLDKEGDPYFYDICFTLDDPEHAHGVIITAHGVSIDWWGGSSTHTNIVPNRLFPDRQSLSESELIHIMDLLSKSNFEGRTYSREEMDKTFKEWKSKGRP